MGLSFDKNIKKRKMINQMEITSVNLTVEVVIIIIIIIMKAKPIKIEKQQGRCLLTQLHRFQRICQYLFFKENKPSLKSFACLLFHLTCSVFYHSYFYVKST